MPATKVTDGASLRKRRILDLLAYIKQNNPDGATTGDCQSFMLAKFGLKFETTSKMLGELHVGGWITQSLTPSHGYCWHCTAKVTKMAAWLYGEE